MKKDMRITYPLWQMGAIVILMIVALVAGMSFNPLENIVLKGMFVSIFIVYFLVFNWQVFRHNKRMPHHKIKLFSLKPQEYMEDDELFQEITKRATKKVYSYYSWSIPLLAFFSISYQWGAVWIVMGLLVLSMGQYLIYYNEIEKYVGEDE